MDVSYIFFYIQKVPNLVTFSVQQIVSFYVMPLSDLLIEVIYKCPDRRKLIYASVYIISVKNFPPALRRTNQ